ncbi:growth-regulating factor 6-like [Iris pallida]|uniref:Growth-regulating factor n=1 Tax=Iris pallida TaxID=29817 RepID=A0AAX6GEL2_IRIPA|nr:growth-regulating factor 6-like [Iris pallida]
MELEHQALVYKYIYANIPVPSALLVPFRTTTTTNPSPLPRSTALGLGPFHLGFSGNADPEPGRCRRSDGKKWRCSRDVVADQKYCERHVNRGRHRSRKHVEGQSGQASKPASIVAPPPPASAVTSQQTKSLMQPKEPSPPRTDRVQMSKEDAKYHDQDSNGFSLMDDSSPKLLDSLFPMSKRQNPFEGTLSRPDFGLIPRESLGPNPLRTSYSDDDDHVSFRNSASKLDEGQPQQHHPLLHFIDDWPKAQSELPSLAWPRTDEGTKSSDRTQLSISIPSNISSSSSPPDQEKPAALSPLRLSRELNPVSVSGGNQRRAGWVPISWEPTMGGPLGEVLNKTNSSASLNLLTDGWEASPRGLQSSPTGVLQKSTATFGSLSSSTGSSPRAENRNKDGRR